MAASELNPRSLSESELDQSLIQRIASINNLPLEEVIPEELAKMIPSGNSKIFDKYAGPQHSTRHRDIYQLFNLAETLLSYPPRGFSYGLFGPTYLSALAETEQSGSKRHNALMLGALTKDTITEYETIVKTFYPNAACFVIDNVEFGKQQREYSSLLVQADARRLPFPDNSFDTVHTNSLLKNLTRPNRGVIFNPTEKEKVFTESYRVLNPGGLLIAVEVTGLAGIDLLQMLPAIGFENVTNKPATQFLNRREMEQFLYNPTKTWSGETQINPKVSVITARKRQ